MYIVHARLHVCTITYIMMMDRPSWNHGSHTLYNCTWCIYRNASQESQPGFLNIYRFRAIFCHIHYFTRHLALCRCQYLNSFQKAGVTLSDITRCLEHWTLDCLASLQPLSPHANLWLSDEQTGRHPYHFHPGEHVGTGATQHIALCWEELHTVLSVSSHVSSSSPSCRRASKNY